MFETLKELVGVELVIFDTKTVSLKTLRAVVIKKVSHETILIIPIDDIYKPMLISEKETLGCSSYRVPEHIYNKIKEMAESARKIEEIEKTLQIEKKKYHSLVQALKGAVFIEKYTPEGACAYLNNLLGNDTLNINENIISLSFFAGDDKDCLEVCIRVSKKFEYFNITSENDIEKAADTYAPVIRDEVTKQFPMFKDVFIVNKNFRKLGDYLYESYCEYNASMDCNKTNFFEKMTSVLSVMGKEVPEI